MHMHYILRNSAIYFTQTVLSVVVVRILTLGVVTAACAVEGCLGCFGLDSEVLSESGCSVHRA